MLKLALTVDKVRYKHTGIENTTCIHVSFSFVMSFLLVFYMVIFGILNIFFMINSLVLMHKEIKRNLGVCIYDI